MSKRHARRVILMAAIVLCLAAAMMVAGSGLAPADERSPYATAIAALELARSPAEVAAALGPPEGEARAVLTRVTYLDFGFLVAYPLLSLAIIWFLARARAARAAAAALAVAMMFGDALENRATLALLGGPADAATLDALALWTGVKWGALFAWALLAAGAMWVRGGGLTRALAVLPLASGIAGAVGLALPAHRPLVEIAGVWGVGATWLLALALAIAALRRSRSS